MTVTQYLDYGFDEFEYIEDPYSKTYINGGSPMTNVAGPARIEERKYLGRDRRRTGAELGLLAAFNQAMREMFVKGMRDALMRPNLLFFGDGTGVLPPPDTRTDWERALDQVFYDPAERAEDELYFNRWCEE